MHLSPLLTILVTFTFYKTDMCIITFFLYNKNAIVFDFTVYGCKMIKMTAINTSILMDGLRTDEIDGNYVQVFVINIYSAFRSCFFFFFVKLLLQKYGLFEI